MPHAPVLWTANEMRVTVELMDGCRCDAEGFILFAYPLDTFKLSTPQI